MNLYSFNHGQRCVDLIQQYELLLMPSTAVSASNTNSDTAVSSTVHSDSQQMKLSDITTSPTSKAVNKEQPNSASRVTMVV